MSIQNNKVQEEEKPATAEPVKVMLADDDKDDQEVFHDALKETDVPAELTTVNNGQELIDKLKDPSEPNPDIIFLDINMPVKNGLKCLEEIKTDDTLKDIPTVILSTSDNTKDVERTFSAGANLYVPKPFSFRNMVLLLKKIFMLKWTGDLFKPLRKSFLMSEKNLPGNNLKS